MGWESEKKIRFRLAWEYFWLFTSILIDGDDVTVLVIKENKSDANFNNIFFTSAKIKINPIFIWNGTPNTR